MRVSLILFTVLLAFAFSLQAQTKAILVKLPTYAKRMAYYKDQHNIEKMLQLQRDVDSIDKYIIADFTENFTYGPVYYFYDTSFEQVKERQLDGALLNTDLTITEHSVIEAMGNNYLVVEYGLSDHEATRGMYRLLTYYPSMERVDISLKTKNMWDNSNSYYSPLLNLHYRGEASILSKKLKSGLNRWE